MRALSKTPALDLPELAGLDQPSLFDTQPVPTGEPLMVPIDRLDQDPNNPRTEFPQQAIDELAQDIAQRGILQPIVVRADESGRYSIRFGSKRWRAALLDGLRDRNGIAAKLREPPRKRRRYQGDDLQPLLS